MGLYPFAVPYVPEPEGAEVVRSIVPVKPSFIQYGSFTTHALQYLQKRSLRTVTEHPRTAGSNQKHSRPTTRCASLFVVSA
jgi:hypothetical protein